MSNENHFKALQEYLLDEKENGEGLFDGAEIEIAYQVNPEQKLVTPGVNVLANSFDSPLFIGIGELRDMADQAEEAVKKLMSEN